MRYRLVLIGSLLLMGVSNAQAPQANDRVKLDLTRAEVQIIVNGLLELPYKSAAPILIELKRQVDAQEPKTEPAPAPVQPKSSK